MLSILALFRSISLYVVLVLVPQCLWLYSSGLGETTPSDLHLCQDCSLLPPGYFNARPTKEGALQEESGKDLNTFNMTLTYEQLCGGVCGLSSSVGEDRLYWMEHLDPITSDGGWSVPHDLPDLTGPCNIHRRNASLTQQEFLEEFAYLKPVILEGVSDQYLFRARSTKWQLLSTYGHDIITVASANTHSYIRTQMTLCEYVEKVMQPQSPNRLANETLYHFGDNDREQWNGLFSLYQLPPYHLPGKEPVLSFGLAGAGTGVPFHIHGPAFAETIFGRKRWFLYPPGESPQFHPDVSTLDWATHTLPSLPPHQTPLQCTLSPGEVLYFPDMWWHATLNVETSVFMSTFVA